MPGPPRWRAGEGRTPDDDKPRPAFTVLVNRPDLTDVQKRGVLAENARQLYRLR